MSGDYYDYYPSVIYKLIHEGERERDRSDDDIYEQASSMAVSGVIKYVNQIKVKGTYDINSLFEINAQILYNCTVNNSHIEKNIDNGFEFACSFTYNIY